MSAPDPSSPPSWLLGAWRLLRAEGTLDFQPGTRMEFRERGELRYTIPVEGHQHVVSLLYRVEGDLLRTDNPSAPHATSTRFWLGEGEMLVFDFAGARAVFVREG